MIGLREVQPVLDVQGDSSPPDVPTETANETGGGDGDKFWKLVRGLGGLGPTVLGQSVQQWDWQQV